jgi:5'-3' exonuclease
MVELEADDALASGAHLAAQDGRVEMILIWTPDKDLAQCVDGNRIVQVDRRTDKVRNGDGVLEKFGVPPALIPDFLALVGDSADGYPGIPRIGAKTAARLISRYGAIEHFPTDVLGPHRADALLFKKLATLRTDAPLFANVDELEWRGPTAAFAGFAGRAGDPTLVNRAARAVDMVPDRRYHFVERHRES